MRDQCLNIEIDPSPSFHNQIPACDTRAGVSQAAMLSAFGRDAVIATHADGNVANLQKAVWYMQKAMELCSAATGNK